MAAHNSKDSLFQAINSGKRAKDILRSLPNEEQYKLATSAKVGIPQKKQMSDAALEGAFPRILKHQKNLKYSQLLSLWSGHNAAVKLDSLRLEKCSWEVALSILISFDGEINCIPEDIELKLLELVSGRLESIRDEQWKRMKEWLSSITIQRQLKKAKDEINSLYESIEKRVRGLSVNDRSQFYSDVTSILSNIEKYRVSCLDSVDVIKSCAIYDGKSGKFSVAIPEGDGERLEMFHDEYFFHVLEEESEAALKDCISSPKQKRIKQLLSIAARLTPKPKERDYQELVKETEFLRSSFEMDVNIDSAEVCPALDALGRVFLDFRPIDDSVLDAFDDLSRKFSRMIEGGEFSLSNPNENSDITLETETNSDLEDRNNALEFCSHFNDLDQDDGLSNSPSVDDFSDVFCNVENLEEETCDEISLEDGELSDSQTNVGMHEPKNASAKFLSDLSTNANAVDKSASEEVISKKDLQEFKVPMRKQPGAYGDVQKDEIIDGVWKSNSRKIANIIASSDAELCSDEINHLLASLLYEGEYDWFYLLSWAWESGAFSPWVAEILELGAQYKPGFMESEERLGELYQNLEDIELHEAFAVLAGSIRPSLMIPHVYPLSAIGKAKEKFHSFPSFMAFINSLEDFASKRFPLSERYLQGLDSKSSFERNMALHAEELKDWLTEAPMRRIKYQVATKIWSKIVKPGGQLRQLVIDVQDPAKCNSVEKRLASWKERSFLEKELEKASRDVFGENQFKKVKYGARARLEDNINYALKLVDKHLDFQKRNSSNFERDNKFIQSSVSILRQNAAEMLNDVESYTKNQSSFELMAAANALYLSVREVETTFQDIHDKKSVFDPLLERRTLQLKIPGWGIQNKIHKSCKKKIVKSITVFLANPISIMKSFNLHLNLGDLDSASKIKDIIVKSDGEKESECEGLYEDKMNEWVRKAESAVDGLSNTLQDYLLRGIVTESEHTAINSDCNSWKRDVECDPLSSAIICSLVEDKRRYLDKIKDSLCVEYKSEVNKILNELDKKGIKSDRNLEDTLQDHLSNAAIGLVQTYIDVLRKGLNEGHIQETELPSETKRINYFGQFASCANNIVKYTKDLKSLAKNIREAKFSCLPNLTSFDDETLVQRSEVIQSWDYLSGRSKNLHKEIQTKKAEPKIFSLLRWLGFSVGVTEKLKESTPHGRPNYWRPYILNAEINDAPLPRFGSKAQGTHHLVFVWNSLDANDFAGWLKNYFQDKNAPIWVFHFSSLTIEDRWRRIVECRKNGLTPILIDTTLLTWLCGLASAERTAGLFDIVLTGAHDNPYTPDSGGSIPKEMFYGRKEDIQRLWDPEGPCILYGGRQLGKSSLLRRVERKYNEHKHGKYVFYVGVHPGDNLWEIFRRTLIDAQLLKSVGRQKPVNVSKAIKKMLDANKNLRILFLLDECDDLLDEDSQNNFEQIKLLRDLMTDTDRRFKAVFTGLHNVQRYDRMPNQPLAHFGSPLRIGPLAPGDAEKLVREPLALLGYNMEQQVVHQVLAQTNYHPSLIQLFCYELVRSMQKSKRNLHELPPITIDNTSVSQVWLRTDLSQRMKDRFDWTLNLDKRYRVIGYSIAVLELLDEGVGSDQVGLDLFQIMKEVKQVWPQGFHDIGHDELSGLLDEMEGLGVVAKQGRERYSLKNSNVITLLGGESGIEDELDRFRLMEPDEHATPEVIHRIDYSMAATSPLTLKQEGDIVSIQGGVHCIFGSKALGLSNVFQALEGSLKNGHKQHFYYFEKGRLNDSVSWIKKNYNKSSSSGEIAFFFDVKEQPERQVVECINAVSAWKSSLRSEKRIVRIVFLLDPQLLISFVLNNRFNEFRSNNEVNFYFLHKWNKIGLNHWFHTAGFPGIAVINQWMNVTGGWHSLLSILQAKRSENCEDFSPDQIIQNKIPYLLKDSGLSDNKQIETLFERLVDFIDEPIQGEDIIDLFKDEYSEGELERSLKALNLLGLLVEGEEGLQPDPVISKVYKLMTD